MKDLFQLMTFCISIRQLVGQTIPISTDVGRRPLSHSLATYLARDDEEIVGLVRLVGDGFSSVFVQDLIVLPSYQRQGIGSNLMKEALADYKDAYQIQLATEQTEKTLGFYRSLGFESLSTYDCTGMIWVDRKTYNNSFILS